MVARAPAIMTSLLKELDTLGVTKGDLAMHGDGRRALAKLMHCVRVQGVASKPHLNGKLGHVTPQWGGKLWG